MGEARDLEEVRWLKYKLIDLQVKRRMILDGALPSGIRYDKDIVQTSPSADILPNLLAKQTEVDAEIAKVDAQLPKAIDRADEIITRYADTAAAANVLRLYFISLMKADDIAEEIGYSIGHVYYLIREIRRRVKHVSESHNNL